MENLEIVDKSKSDQAAAKRTRKKTNYKKVNNELRQKLIEMVIYNN